MKSNAIIITISDIAAELCADCVRIPTLAELREQDAIQAEIDAQHDEYMREIMAASERDRKTYNWLRDPENWDVEFYSDVFKDYYGFRPWQPPSVWWR